MGLSCKMKDCIDAVGGKAVEDLCWIRDISEYKGKVFQIMQFSGIV